MGCEVEKPGGNISWALQGAAVGCVNAPILWSESTWKYRLALLARQTTLGTGGWTGSDLISSRTLPNILEAPVAVATTLNTPTLQKCSECQEANWPFWSHCKALPLRWTSMSALKSLPSTVWAILLCKFTGVILSKFEEFPVHFFLPLTLFI